MLLRVGRVNNAKTRHLVIEAARTDHKHTQDPYFPRQRTAREDTSELMVCSAGKKLTVLTA